MIENNNHLYHIGTLFVCGCEKSKVWTNSIRDDKKLLALIDGTLPRNPYGKVEYTNGFCDDLYCGFTLKDKMQVMQSGVDVPGASQRADVIGNPKHKTNVKIATFGQKELMKGASGEATKTLIDFYTRTVEVWRNLVRG